MVAGSLLRLKRRGGVAGNLNGSSQRFERGLDGGSCRLMLRRIAF